MSDLQNDNAKVPAADKQEISASGEGRDITKPYVGPLEINQDSVLAARGGGLEIYEELLRDDQVHSCLQQRFARVCAREWQVDAGGTDKASVMFADFMREMMFAPSLEYDDRSRKMLFALYYGYGVAECMWAQDGKNIYLDQLRVRRARRFRFDTEGGLRLLTVSNQVPGELMPDRKFWTWSVGADNDDAPYGLGLGHWCYWPVYIKRNGLKFWAIFLDKYGSPTAKGVFPPGTTKDDQNKLLQAMRAIQTDAAIVLPAGMTAELLQAARSAGADYDLLYDRMDKAIAKVIASQTMTTEDGSSKAQGQVHEGVAEFIAKTDGDMQSASFMKGPVRWLRDWNYPDAQMPKIYRNVIEEDDLDTRADRDNKIRQMGFKPSVQYINETYGGDWSDAPLPETVTDRLTDSTPSPAFAEDGGDDAITKRVTAILKGWKDVTGPAAEQIIAAAEQAKKESDPVSAFRKVLDGLRDKLNMKSLERRVAIENFQSFAGGALGETTDKDRSAADAAKAA